MKEFYHILQVGIKENISIGVKYPVLIFVLLIFIGDLQALYTVTNTNNSGAGSLRQAILDANTSPGLDSIIFNIPGAGPHTINVPSALPNISQPLFIDGTSEPDYTGSPIIELNGTGTGSSVDGLVLAAGSDSSIIRGLVINRFGRDGISGTANNVIIAGNYLGTDVSGTIDMGNSDDGIQADGNNWTIGGTSAADRNLVSGNGDEGIQLTGDGNIVLGNYIGTDITGSIDLGNTSAGLMFYNNASGNTIGGTDPGDGNVISGNNSHGVDLVAGCNENTLLGNIIGLTASGTEVLGNSSNGIQVSSANNIIGGTTSTARNVVSANAAGINLSGAGATGNIIRGNYLGTDINGTLDLGNTNDGVLITAGASNNTVGGTVAGAGNLISGNNSDGIEINNLASTGNVIQGNYIGTDITGTEDLGNNVAGVRPDGSNNTIGGTTAEARNVISGNTFGFTIGSGTGNKIIGNYIGTNTSATAKLGNMYGIWITIGTGNFIGDTLPGSGNVISGNTQYGVYFSDDRTNQNVVWGNYIGTNAGGQDLGNGSAGIMLASETTENQLGGSKEGAGNTIAFNGYDGIWLNNDAGSANAILRNSIYSNSGIGIDLLNDNVTANDVGDGDTGPNDLQNYPLLTGAISADGNTTISGSLNSTAGTSFRIEFFSSPSGDATGFGEGQTYLGFIRVTTDGSGNVAFDTTLAGVTTSLGHVVTATATVDLGGDNYGNTSEFAANVTVSQTPPDNDLPCKALLLNVSQDCSDSIFSNSGATDSGIPLLDCSGYTGSDVWFKLLVPPSGELLVLLDTEPTPEFPDPGDWLDRVGLAVYSGTCESLNHDSCWIDEGGGGGPYADPAINLAGYTPGDTLFLRVWGYSGQTGNFKVCARAQQSIFNLSGSGKYCTGSGGLDVILDSSRIDRTYYIIKNGAVSGLPVEGTGGPITWPGQTAGVYRVISTGGPLPNPYMNGKVIIQESPLPVLSLGYQFYKTITIEADSVSGTGDLIQFPAFVSISNDTNLRTTENGGKVHHDQGYDIAFTDGSFDPLPFEIIRYDSSVGSLEAWVSVPILSGSTDTELQILYGNPDITHDPSSPNIWGPEYLQVLHLDDDFLDASRFGNTGNNYHTIDTTGKLYSARYFDGTDNVITVLDDTALDGSNDEATLSLWINFDNAIDGDHQLVMSSSNRYSGADGFEWASQGDGDHFFYPRGNVHDNYNMILSPFSNGKWHYLAVTLDFDTKEVVIYVDGKPRPLIYEGVASFWTGLAGIDNWYWGGNPERASRYFAGSMDEIRVLKVVRTEDWLRTEYSNQAFPSAFINVSPENEFNLLTDVCERVPAFPLNGVYPVGGSFSGTGISEGTFDPGLAGPGDHIITYDYTDSIGCFSSGKEVITVLASPVPVISGNANTCPDTQGETYFTPDIDGHSFFWTITGEGATISQGQGTNELSVDWGSESGTVRVTETINATGCDSTTADFFVIIEDITDPYITCPVERTEYIDGNCEFTLQDYTTSVIISEYCGPDPAISQLPVPGTIINGSGTFQEIIVRAVFDGGKDTSCSFNILLQDSIPPEVTSLRDTTVDLAEGIYRTFLTMPLPTFTDNCGVQTVVNDFNGGSDASGEYAYGTTTVTYTVTDDNDNVREFTQLVTLQLETEPEWGLVIPEGFSPNEDGLNDRFEILGLEQYPDNELRVFNVHGNEVYRMSGYDNTWDGTSASNLNKGGRLPTGTYYYALYLQTVDAVIKGFVYLRRE